jgi:hypothetical protein
VHAADDEPVVSPVAVVSASEVGQQETQQQQLQPQPQPLPMQEQQQEQPRDDEDEPFDSFGYWSLPPPTV